MKELKRLFSSLLVLAMLVTSVPMEQVKASDAVSFQEQEAETLNSAGAQIQSIVWQDVEVIEGTNGSKQEWTNPSTGEVEKWFKYDIPVKAIVTFADGTVEESYYVAGEPEYGAHIFVNGWPRKINVESGQSGDVPWGVGTYTATASIEGVENSEGSFTVDVTESPIDRIELVDITTGEYMGGRVSTEYNPETGLYDKEFYYYEVPFIVHMKNGTTQHVTGNSFYYEGNWYPVNITPEQTYDNPWGIGSQEVTVTVMGQEVKCNYTITESPVERVEIEPVKVVENISGSMQTHPAPDGGVESYFTYEYSPKFKVTLKGGRTLSGQGGIHYENKYYSISYQDDQSSATPWGVGKHTVVGKIFGKEVPFEVEVVENPIEDVKAHDITIPAYTSGRYEYGYGPGMSSEQYYRYSYEPRFTVTYKDDTVEENVHSLEIAGQTFWPSYWDGQSYETPWGVGNHEVTGTFLGKEFSFNVEITESPYVSLEVLKVNPVIENTNCYVDGEGNVIYDIPTFSFKATRNDGTTEYGIYDSEEELGYWSELGLQIVDTQSEKPWKAGSENSFTLKSVGLEIEVPVELRAASKYTYVEQNGGIYITSCQDTSETIEIPAQIDGKKVIGIVSLGDALSWATKIVIPDSVQSIGAEAFQYYPSSLQTLEIGSGVNYLDADMFSGNWSLENITISKDNPYYCAVDGIVYDKNMTTVVVYPMGHGYEYTVPATVTDIGVVIASGMVDITFEEGSTAYVTEDGVTYTADKTKVIYCNPSKTGSYEMPNSVTDIAEVAFWGSQLKEIKISNKVTEIAYGTFLMSSLESVQLPSSLKSIEKRAFWSCESLKDINFPEGLEHIGQEAFSYTSMTTLNLPDSVEKIGSSAFCYTDIKELSLGKNLKEIGQYAFYNSALKEVIIPDNTTHIGQGAFSCNEKMTKVVIGKGVQELEESTFAGCSNLKEVVLKNEISMVGDGVFSGCPIQTINMENIKGKIGDYAFSDLSISSVTFAEGVTEIAYGAFKGSQSLETIDLPDSLVRLDGYAFHKTAWEDAQEEGPVYLEQVFYEYKGQMQKDTELVIKDGTTIIADYALGDYEELKSVTLPQGLKTIGYAAFRGSSNIKEISIPATVTYIGEAAFSNCGSLEAIHVDPANEHFSSVDGVLFNKDGTELIWCPKRMGDTYQVPHSVKVIAEGAFETCGVENIVIRNSNVELKQFAFGNNYKGVTIHCFAGSTAEAYAEQYFLPTEIMEYKPITKVELDATSLQMKEGEKVTLKATISPIDTTDDTSLTWSSSHSSVATVEDGIVKALKIGSATITVKTSNGKTATCVVKVLGEAKWEKDQNGWKYHKEDGNYPKNQWFEIDGNWYYFNGAGYRAENQWVGSYYVNSDGVMVKNQWVGAYYIGADGQYISSAGWLEIDGKWYYLNYGGARITGWQAVGGTWYYFDTKGVMQTGKKTIGGTRYYFLSSGAMATGWQAIDGDWYYYAGSGAQCTGWQAIGGTWYYFDTEGVMATGKKTIGGIGYYFLSSGAMATGWQVIDGDWYYFAGSGAMATGWQAIGGTWYYFDAEGVMATGEKTIGGTRYYFAGSGAMATGWQLLNGEWYYFAGSGAMCKDWQAIGGTWYYFNAEGVMLTGKKTIGGAEYYFLSSGAMATGWQVIGGEWYYFAGSGAMVKNQWVGNYYMLEDGVMATNQWIGNYYVGADGLWQPNARK